MRVLFIHQNMPGQFAHLASALGRDPENEIVFVTRRKDRQLPGVARVAYDLSLPPREGVHEGTARFTHQVLFGEAVVRACQAVSLRGFRPDVIVGHPGWGELMFVKDIFPDTPLISYCEFYYDPRAAYFQGDPPQSLTLDERVARHAQTAHLLLSLQAADLGWSPTKWQKSVHPKNFHDKIEIIFDGVDTNLIRPDRRARFDLPNGSSVGWDDEVITYAARNLEPCRGFPSFIRSLPRILQLRPSAQVVIAGAFGPHYDAPPPGGRTWREVMLKEVSLDPNRVHFVGSLPRPRFLQMLQVSSAHVYLTSPIVLSWSFIEAMSAGCLVVASDTAPVREFLDPGVNGLATLFEDPAQIAFDVNEALKHSDADKIKTAARRLILECLSLDVCLPIQKKFLVSV